MITLNLIIMRGFLIYGTFIWKFIMRGPPHKMKQYNVFFQSVVKLYMQLLLKQVQFL